MVNRSQWWCSVLIASFAVLGALSPACKNVDDDGECANDSDCFYLAGYNDPHHYFCCGGACVVTDTCQTIDRATCEIIAGNDGEWCSTSGATDLPPFGACCAGSCVLDFACNADGTCPAGYTCNDYSDMCHAQCD